MSNEEKYMQRLVHFVIMLAIFFFNFTPVMTNPVVSAETVRTLTEMSKSFEFLAEKVTPAVVQIFATSYGPGRSGTTESLLTKQRGSGSGVILDAEGYIVTNAHVIEGAHSIKVRLSNELLTDFNGQSILKPSGKLVSATLLGVDRETDLAVLKINEPNLPFLKLGDSDTIKKGQLVFAFGSPLGLENSVTMGVVSATARQLEPEDPMIYIQTDTPINPGNSGGPLVNTEGDVIGINTLILSQSGGSEGIGFAAPCNIVRNVYEQICETGKVSRAMIGIRVQTISPLMAAGLDLSQQYGVVISDVSPDSPAQKEGLREGDIILALDEKPMENGRQFEVNLYSRRVGRVVKLDVLRNTEKRKFWVPVRERLDNVNRFLNMTDPKRNLIHKLGILAIDLDDEIKKLLPPLRKTNGVLVAARSMNAPFVFDGLQAGDVLYSINSVHIVNLSELKNIMEQFAKGDAIVAQIERKGHLRYVAFELE